MNATEIIELLRQHPQACGVLGIELSHNGVSAYQDQLVAFDHDKSPYGEIWSRWLIGAAVEKCDEAGIDLPVRCLSNGVPYYAVNDGNETSHPTFLHALLAGLEAHKQ